MASKFEGVRKKPQASQGWAGVAAKAASVVPPPPPALSSSPAPKRAGLVETIKIPPEVWSPSYNPSHYHIEDPMERFEAVNKAFPRTVAPLLSSGPVGLVDFHFQSVSTLSTIIEGTVGEARKWNGETWVITGRGAHVDSSSFQKQGGVIAKEVEDFLVRKGIKYKEGKGGGAFLVI